MSIRRSIELSKQEPNRRVYRIMHRLVLESTEGVCSRCHGHKGHNRRKNSRTWKQYRRAGWKLEPKLKS